MSYTYQNGKIDGKDVRYWHEQYVQLARELDEEKKSKELKVDVSPHRVIESPDYLLHILDKPFDCNKRLADDIGDPLRAIKGIVIGLLLSIPVWCAIVAVVYLMLR